jgi:glutamate carboxypeptidase
MYKLISTILIAFTFSGTFAQRLSREEKKIISAIEDNKEASIQLLEQIVNINSGTMNLEGVKEVGMVLKEEFENIGMTTQWIDMASVERSGHLFAETIGKKGKRILLIGHLDTVFPKTEAFQKMERKENGIVYGPGANDMKGGDIIMLYALKALYEVNLLEKAQIIVALTGDEELTGKPLSVSRKDLIDAGKRSDIALGFETSTGFDNVTLARRGSSGWKVEIEGKRAHSSGIFSEDVGAGAIFEAGRILNDFYEEISGEEYLTFNPGVMVGGTIANYDEPMNLGDAFGKTNVVAQKAVIDGDLRFISEEQKENTRQKMRAIVTRNLPQTSAKITFFDSYPSMAPTLGNEALMEKFSKVSLDLGQGPVTAWDPSKRGAADISFVAQYADCIDGLGAMGSGGHTPNESVDLNSIEMLTKRAAILIYRLINE